MRTGVRLLVAVLLVFLLAPMSCGGSSPSPEDSGSDGAMSTDSSLAAWPKAEEAVHKVAADAILLSVGTGGLALADVPDSWSFTFFSPAQNHLYTVSVDHGEALPASDFGAAKQDLEVSSEVDIESITVGAAEAVEKAREYGEQSGTIPKNVMVTGSFAKVTGASDLGTTAGVWTVTFASSTDLADAVVFKVDMMTGAVTKSDKQV